jgi:hypothetical protein
MASSKIAKSKAYDSYNRALKKENNRSNKQIISTISRFSDSGTTGNKEAIKRLKKAKVTHEATMRAISKKTLTDIDNVDRYGKGAMKSRGFATMPNTKAKPKLKTMKNKMATIKKKKK